MASDLNREPPLRAARALKSVRLVPVRLRGGENALSGAWRCRHPRQRPCERVHRRYDNKILAIWQRMCYKRQMTECAVDDCRTTATTRGLCPKHYMRLRRHEAVNVTHTRGRKPDPKSVSAIVRSLFPHQSPRTQARYARALTLDRKVQDILGVDSYIKRAIRLATRPNGSVNFAELLRIMECQAAFAIAEHCPDTEIS